MTIDIPTWPRVQPGQDERKVHFAVCLDGVVQQIMTISPTQAGLWIEQPLVVLCNTDAKIGDTIESATAGI